MIYRHTSLFKKYGRLHSLFCQELTARHWENSPWFYTYLHPIQIDTHTEAPPLLGLRPPLWSEIFSFARRPKVPSGRSISHTYAIRSPSTSRSKNVALELYRLYYSHVNINIFRGVAFLVHGPKKRMIQKYGRKRGERNKKEKEAKLNRIYRTAPVIEALIELWIKAIRCVREERDCRCDIVAPVYRV